MSKKRKKKYSKELKLEAIQSYLNGEGGLRTICKKFGISDKKSLRTWIKWYNGHREIKERREAGTEIYMTKGRKTTQEERVEIVAFCIEHGKDYPLTIQTYEVSYQQIYAWVRKYEENGIDGFKDGRGRTRPLEELSEEERLRMENKILKAQLKDVEGDLLLMYNLAPFVSEAFEFILPFFGKSL
jgi:transposase-like protein